MAWAVTSAVAEATGGAAPPPPKVAVAELGPASARVDVDDQVVEALAVAPVVERLEDVQPEVVDAELVDEPEPEASPGRLGVRRDPHASVPFVDPQASGQRRGWGAGRGRW